MTQFTKPWILIISDVHLANFDARIFDTKSKVSDDLLLYDVELDVHVRYLHDSEARTEIIEFESEFSGKRGR